MRLEGRFERGEERSYRHVPFPVPQGVRQLHVLITYPDRVDSDPLSGDGSTLDIGLFDERGIEAGGPGFRGWSGSERLAITIDESWATPPYRPGEIGAGTWHLLVGPYKVARGGLPWVAEIWFDLGLPPEDHHVIRTAVHARPSLPPPVEHGWYRGDLHCHSLFSDGDSWPSELLIAAAEAGLDFLGITDHNGAVRPVAPEIPGLPLLVPGIEVTTNRGHWNVWGVDGWFEFRDCATETMIAEMERARAAGGLVSVNHPRPWGPDWDYGETVGADAIEVWNGPWHWMNPICLAEWEERLLRGERPVALGGSDAHVIRPHGEDGPVRELQLGTPTLWVRVDGALSVTSLLAGIRAGDVFLSSSPSGPQLYMNIARNEVRVRAVGATARTLVLIADAEPFHTERITSDDHCVVTPAPAAMYVRAEIRDDQQIPSALTNARFLTVSG